MKKVSPREQARNKLLELYHKQTELLGRKPKEEEFFPVDLDELRGFLLPDWGVIESRDLLHHDVSNPILGKADFDQKTFYLDSDAELPARRFTTAHEFGHVFLGHGGCKLRRDEGPRSALRPQQLEPPGPVEVKQEREANAFAAELLMPERAVLREFRKRFEVDRLSIRSSQAQLVLNNIYERAEDAAVQLATSRYPANSRPLMDFFGVSRGAMRVRLLQLSLVY